MQKKVHVYRNMLNCFAWMCCLQVDPYKCHWTGRTFLCCEMYRWWRILQSSSRCTFLPFLSEVTWKTYVYNQCMDEWNINNKWKLNIQNNGKKNSYIPVIQTKVWDINIRIPSALQPVVGILEAHVFHQPHWNKCEDFKSVLKTGNL